MDIFKRNGVLSVVILLMSGCLFEKALPQMTPTPSQGRCPTNTSVFGWSSYGDYCYAASFSTNYFDTAASICRSAGGRSATLASIHSQLEGQFIYDLFKSSYSGEYWIGMSKAGAGERYNWTDGSDVEYSNWSPGEPNDVHGYQNCVKAFRNDLNMWDDFLCNSYLPFICKVRKAPPPTTPPPPIEIPGKCPSSEWEEYGACFLFRPVAWNTWQEAEDICMEYGGHLATLKNKNENWFIHRRLTELTWLPYDRHYWIGLIKENGGKEFMWITDGSTANFTNWSDGFPSKNKTRLCVQIAGELGDGGFDSPSGLLGGWTDGSCSKRHGYVCRAEKGEGNPDEPSANKGNIGLIVGAVIGSIVGVVVIAAAGYYGYKKYQAYATTRKGIENNSVVYDTTTDVISERNIRSAPSPAPVKVHNPYENDDLDSNGAQSFRYGRLDFKSP